MLSYQHSYHAGNPADVHKHFLLAAVLAYLIRKDKPLSYIETHAGRGLYDLSQAAARKTGEAAAGIEKMLPLLAPDDPYGKAVEKVRGQHGRFAYPGSPLLAASILRPQDQVHLAELHPQEHRALQATMAPFAANCHRRDGFDLAHAICPPTPRRGLLLIDPSYEIKDDYGAIPQHVAKITKSWNVGIVALWYPILKAAPHLPMVKALEHSHPGLMRSEVRFAPAREGHGMVGSGMLFINPPYGTDVRAAEIERHFRQWES